MHHFEPSQIDQDKLEHRWHLLSTEGPKSVGVHAKFNPLKNPPSWYDPVRFRRAQKMGKKYFLSLNVAHFIGNILLIHLPDVLIPVLATGHSASPYAVFMRILSTVIHILSWYEEDPFDENTKTHRSMLIVRRNCHMAVSRLMNGKYPRKDRLWLSQFDMAMTQWSLIGIVGIRPQQCGFYGTTREEFEEYFYFWKVIGYCVGIEDRFNVCLDHFDESVAYLDICFQRCYKVHLDRQCQAVQQGMQLTEGVFLALNSVTPRLFVCYESFMGYWYNTLGVKHPIQLDTYPAKLYYHLFAFIFDYLLRIRPFYVIFSWIFFFLQQKLFTKIAAVKFYSDKHLSHIRYQLKTNYEHEIKDTSVDSNNNPEEEYYQVDNYFYKPNVKDSS